MSYELTIEQSSVLNISDVTSTATVCDWFSYCREVCVDALEKEYEEGGTIGGSGKIVEIDESKIGKQKYNRGRMLEGHGVFGMVERDFKNYRLEICPGNKRDAVTLLALLQKHVEPGSIIFSDMWKAYDCLDQHGYEHGTVNHSENFVDSVTCVYNQHDRIELASIDKSDCAWWRWRKEETWSAFVRVLVDESTQERR